MYSLRPLFRDRSFVYKFTLLTTIPVIFVALCIALLATKTLEQSITEATNIRIKRNTYLAALSISNPYVIYNKALLDSFVDSLKQEKDIIYAFIVDYNDGYILVHSDHSKDGQYYEPTGPVKIQLSGTGTDGIAKLTGIGYEAVSAIRIAGDLFGTVRVGYTLDSVHKEIISLRMKIAGITFLAIIFSILLSIFLARLLGKPILSLASQAQEVAEGNFEQEITYDSKDVVGRLSSAFKKMTEELRKRLHLIESNEKKYRALFETSNDAVFILDEEKIIDCNQQALNIFKDKSNDLLGKRLDDLSPEKQPDGNLSKTIFRRKIKEVMNGQRHRFCWRHLCLDRTELDTEVSLSPTSISEKKMVLGVVQDITERKAAEEEIKKVNEELEKRVDLRTAELNIANHEMQESEERFRTIAAAAQSAIVMINQDGNIQFWNKSAQTIFGWSPEEVAGKDIHKLLAPEQYHADSKKGLAVFKETAQGTIIGQTLEMPALRKDNKEIIIEMAITAVQLKGKLNAVGISNDITARKKAEEKLQRNMEELTRFNKLAVGREQRMIELKEEINELLINQGREKKYKIVG